MRLRLLLSALALTLSVSAQEPVFHAGVSLVRVDIEASDSAGNILTALRQEDFRVLDNGAPQTPVGFSFEKEPLDLILLFDTSRAMGGKLHQVLRAVELGFHELQRGDRVCVMTYSSVAIEVAPFTTDMDAVNQTILLKVLPAGFAGSAKADVAVRDAAMRFRREPETERRRAILTIGDLRAPGSTVESAVGELWQSNAVFSQLIPDKSGKNRILPLADNPMAGRTGGDTVVAGDPGPAFQDSLRRLRRRYTIYYPMPQAPPGSLRRIEAVLLPEAAARLPGTVIRARTGYVIPAH